MRNIRILSAGLLVGVIALVGSIRTTHASSNPFDPLWEAIHALQAQVDGIHPGLPATYNRLVDTVIPPRSESPGTTPAYAFCDDGDTMLSGGYTVNFFGFDVIQSVPFGEHAWAVGIANQNDIQKTVTVIVRCADTTP